MPKTRPPAEPLILDLASPAASLRRVGGKGASLARLAAAGLPVPAGFHLSTLAYRRFLAENHLAEGVLRAAARARPEDPASLARAAACIGALMAQGRVPEDIAAAVRAAYAALPGGGAGEPAVAVRSSATAEDLPELSFAGQQESYLNVRGEAALLAAIQRCWASLWTARALGYRARHGIRSEDVALAVVVQVLVPAEAAGILFTANPVSGARDEALVSAAWGLGEAVVGGLLTPDSFVVDKASGALRSATVADKAVMTVRTAGGTHEMPVPAEQRRRPALGEAQAADLSRLGAEIEALYGQPMDIEWALAEGRAWILQARPITALPAPPVRLDWPVPSPGGLYARASVIELLPDPLSPLFASLALPAWTAETQAFLRHSGMAPAVPVAELVTVNDYAYYHYAFGLRQLGAILPALPELARRFGRYYARPVARWAWGARPRYAAVVAAWLGRDLAGTSAGELVAGVRAITAAAAEYYLTIQSGILPAAYSSEALFAAAYRRLVQGPGDPPALQFLLGFDSQPIRAERALHDLAAWARGEPELAAYLARSPGAELAAALASGTPPIAAVAAWRAFGERFAAHLARFGHAVYDLDFAKSVPADDPAPLLDALRFFLPADAPDPRVRQAAAAAAREAATAAVVAPGGDPRRSLVARLLLWAQRFAPLREEALADLGLGWPVLRRMLGELGRRLVASGALTAADEVFWLTAEELDAAARALDAGRAPAAAGAGHTGAPLAKLGDPIAERRARWDRARRATPPQTLPEKAPARFFGIDYSRWMPARDEQAEADRLYGIGASPGRVTGPARVLRGPEDFGLMRPGEILVARITTPAWTPLFAVAAGIVTDIGGPLSHSSIVAREYRIPAVLGTGSATARLGSGQELTVDGDAGVVILLRDRGPRAPSPAERGQTDPHLPRTR